jgi:hypothetical protein
LIAFTAVPDYLGCNRPKRDQRYELDFQLRPATD